MWSTAPGGTRPSCATWLKRRPREARCRLPGGTWRTSTPPTTPRRPSSTPSCPPSTRPCATTSPGTCRPAPARPAPTASCGPSARPRTCACSSWWGASSCGRSPKCRLP
ncbi:unnamed protein product [Gulo gulo]|uniref:Uncharacterized protein n=1 Tax=Gulo gulo TaxID=48420 RepID=A0A9X9QAR5_GULGU|nr:unnamed protein product [Gulo gulo]